MVLMLQRGPERAAAADVPMAAASEERFAYARA
jgi:hypothetical protein